MNCKPGDLAVIVRAPADDRRRALGALVTVQRRDVNGNYPGLGKQLPTWIVRSVQPLLIQGGVFSGQFRIPDIALRPIRDQPGADETLTWKEVPKPAALSPKRQVEHAR